MRIQEFGGAWCRWRSVAALAITLGILLFALQSAAGEGEKLILFVQPEASPLAKTFDEKWAPKLEELADDLGIGFERFDIAARGVAPAGVHITPLIGFQSAQGESIYQGRYTTIDRVKNFVQTSRFMPQTGATLTREQLPVWQKGEVKIAAPLKITPVAGPGAASSPLTDPLIEEIHQAIAAVEPRFKWAEEVSLGKSDRQFYLDFYPYVSDESTLYLSMSLFSQFHCHEPIWSLPGVATTGPWSEAPALFAQGFAMAAAEIERQLAQSELGDGFDRVPQETAVVSWSDAGLSRPEADVRAGQHDSAVELTLPEDWEMDVAVQAERPAVQFSFPAPLDAYAGQVLDVQGELTLGPEKKVTSLRGKFVADPSTVTMGEPDLDAAIYSSILQIDAYPEASFEIESVSAEDAALEFGRVTAAVLNGRFTMKGQSIDLKVPASVEVFVGRDGRARLSIDGRWQIRLADPFAIDGPPGDAPANDTLIYRCHLVFAASGSKREFSLD